MALLNEAQIITPGQAVPPPPPRTCEACGAVVPVGHNAINIIMVVGSPGSPKLDPFQCTEHWACSPACWQAVAHACIDEHMHPALLNYRQTVGL